MPRPTDTRERYLPGLDGTRAVAVLAVILFHLGVPGMSGGLLGVGLFFTLSGYLITGILLRSHASGEGDRSLALGTFWLRRARRLLPAVLVVLFVVVVTTATAAPERLRHIGGQALAALAYVHNWVTIAAGQSYFDRFHQSPLSHLWSLAVEEQFYLVWPLLLLLLLRVAGGNRIRLVSAVLGLAALSFLLLFLLHHPGFDNTRAYEGTDTRAGGLLVGAALAVVWNADVLRRRLRPWASRSLDAIGLSALAGIGYLIATTDEYSSALYSWGLLGLTVATTALIAAAVHPSTWTSRLLSLPPLLWIGERSYGIYLWHLPLIVATPDTLLSDLPVQRGALQLAATLGLAELSWRFLENPIREHGFRGALARAFGPRHRGYAVAAAAAAATLSVVALGVNQVVLATRTPEWAASAEGASVVASGLDPLIPPTPDTAASETPETTTTPSTPSTSTAPDASATPATTTPATPAGGIRSSCRAVVHVGDSTSVGLVNAAYLPKAKDRLAAQYAAVGATTFHDEISGARSIVERVSGLPNAQDVLRRYPRSTYDGCFVIAMGTNDPANQYVGGTWPLPERIDLVMKLTDGRPTLWLTAKTLKSAGPYNNKEMGKWNAALRQACTRYPNMRVYDWAGEVQSAWFINDGIHYTTPGYRQRAHRIAQSLALAFPQDRPSPPSCLVGSLPAAAGG